MKNKMTLSRDDPTRALFIMDGDYMQPYIRAGEAVRVQFTLPQIGQCGLFRAGAETLVRQYCEDSFGNIYLFVLDRTQSALDRRFPPDAPPVCLGTLLLDKTPPLPLY